MDNNLLYTKTQDRLERLVFSNNVITSKNLPMAYSLVVYFHSSLYAVIVKIIKPVMQAIYKS